MDKFKKQVVEKPVVPMEQIVPKTAESPIQTSKAPDILIPDHFGDYKIAYHYKGEEIALPNIENCMSVKMASELSFENEPTNEYDKKAIRIIADGKFIGYVYKGKIQDMIHDFTKRKEPIYAILQSFDDINNKVSMFIAFYRNPFEIYSKCESIKTKLVKCSKKVDEYTNRQDNFCGVKRGDTITIEYNEEYETYVALDECGGELGEISKSISAKIKEREDMDEPICIVEETAEDDNGKYGANVLIYFK
jgi:hypothetical protein